MATRSLELGGHKPLAGYSPESIRGSGSNGKVGHAPQSDWPDERDCLKVGCPCHFGITP